MASVFGSASPQVLIQQDPRLQRRLALAQNLQQQGSSTAPVQHFTQALARALQGYMGGRAQYQAEQELKKRQAGATQGITSALQAATTRPQLPGPNVEDPAAMSEDFSASQYNPGTGQMMTPPPGGTAFNAAPSLGQAPGMQGMISSLLQGGNPDLAGLATQLQLGQMGNEQAFQQQIRLAREKAALRPAKDARTSLQKEAEALYPGNPAKQRDFISSVRTKPLVSQNEADPLLKSDIKSIETQEEAVGAEQRDLVPRVRIALRILESGKAATGFGEEQKLQIRRIGKALGFDVDGVAETELLQSVTNYLIPRMRVVGSGSTSDKEMESFAKSTVRMQGTVEGNKLIARTYLQIADHNKKRLNFSKQFLRKNKRGPTGDEIDAAVGPVFPLPTISSDADYDKLPSGMEFLDPEGTKRRKP
tara:strand:- start:3628 stop:4887 length:1260 start_codon:yes stop_codon:yes gene_type:complete